MLVADYYPLRVCGRGGECFLLYVEVLEITEFDQIRAKVEIVDERHPFFCLFPILFDSHLWLYIYMGFLFYFIPLVSIYK